MGSPNINDALNDNKEAIDAVKVASQSAADSLNNEIQTGTDYINKNTKGIVQTFNSTATWYSKFSEDFSLAALDGIIDSVVKLATDAMEAELTEGTDPKLLAETTADVGSLIKGVLSLAASSSSTEQNLQVSFNYMVVGDENFVVYLGYNSTSVDAQNAWGSKDITVVAITYIVAQVNPNPAITRAKMLQDDLNTLVALNEAFNKAIIAATNEAQYEALNFRLKEMQDLEARIKKLLADETAKTS